VKLDVATLKRVSPLLDEVLDLEHSDREAWLARLETTQADLAPIVRELLAKESLVETNDVLQRGPEFTAPAQDAHHSEFVADDSVGPYRLVRELGVGGMGEVWLAKRADGVLKRSVALKLPMLSLKRSVLVQRFERERDILGSLTHPNIARLYDAGVASDGQPYLALEYVDGLSIAEYAKTQSLDARERVKLLCQVMDAVQYAHANLVIHRDLKPSNVMVTVDGKALLLDFGIAKLLQEEASEAHETELTRIGGRALTLQYAAPEQVLGLPIGIATDVWALGVLLYELMSEKRPFDGVPRSGIENAVLHTDPASPSKHKTGPISNLSKSFASELDTIVLKALKKAPEERYGTVAAFADDLKRWLNGEAVLAQPDSTWYRTKKFVGRHKLAVIGTTIASATTIAIAVVAVVMGLRATEESARAIAGREFLVNMFRQADPDLTNGKVIAADLLLERGRETLLKTMGSQPLLQADLLRGIGEALVGMKEYEKADAAYSSAVDNLQKLGKSREAAMVLLDRIQIAQDLLGDVDRSERLLLEVDRVYSDQRDDEFMARYLAAQIYLAYLRDNKLLEGELIGKAAPYVDRAFKNSTSSRAVYTIRVLAEAESNIDRHQSAIDRLSPLLARMDPTALEHSADMHGVLNDLATFEYEIGRYRSSMERFESADKICATSLNPKGQECLITQWHRIDTLLKLGYRQEALTALPTLLDKKTDTADFESMYVAYRVLASNRSFQLFPSVTVFFSEHNTPSDINKMPPSYWKRLTHTKTHYALQEGRIDEAEKLLEQAKSLYESGKNGFWRPKREALIYRGLIAEARGEHVEAQRLLKEAVDVSGQHQGTDHPQTLLVSVNLVRPLWATHQEHEAMALLDHVIPILTDAMGTEAPTLLRIKALRNELINPGSFVPPATWNVEIFF